MPYPATRADALRAEVSGVEIKELHSVHTVPGVAILFASGRNGPGRGWIKSAGTNGTRISWKAPGSSNYGPPVDASGAPAGTLFVLEDADDPNAFVRVAVYPTYFLTSGAVAEVRLEDVYNEVGIDDVSSPADFDVIQTQEITLSNDSSMPISDVRAWLARPTYSVFPAAMATKPWDRWRKHRARGHSRVFPVSSPKAPGIPLQISKDGINWYRPWSEDDPDVLIWSSIAAGGTATLHLRKVVKTGSPSAIDVLSLVHLSWLGL